MGESSTTPPHEALSGDEALCEAAAPSCAPSRRPLRVGRAAAQDGGGQWSECFLFPPVPSRPVPSTPSAPDPRPPPRSLLLPLSPRSPSRRCSRSRTSPPPPSGRGTACGRAVGLGPALLPHNPGRLLTFLPRPDFWRHRPPFEFSATRWPCFCCELNWSRQSRKVLLCSAQRKGSLGSAAAPLHRLRLGCVSARLQWVRGSRQAGSELGGRSGLAGTKPACWGLQRPSRKPMCCNVAAGCLPCGWSLSKLVQQHTEQRQEKIALHLYGLFLKILFPMIIPMIKKKKILRSVFTLEFRLQLYVWRGFDFSVNYEVGLFRCSTRQMYNISLSSSNSCCLNARSVYWSELKPVFAITGTYFNFSWSCLKPFLQNR